MANSKLGGASVYIPGSSLSWLLGRNFKYCRTTGKDKNVDDLGSLQFALCDDDCYTAEMIHATSSRAGIDRRVTFFECKVLFVFNIDLDESIERVERSGLSP